MHIAEKWKRSFAALGAAALLGSFAPGRAVMAEQKQNVCLNGVDYPSDSTELTLSALTAKHWTS